MITILLLIIGGLVMLVMGLFIRKERLEKKEAIEAFLWRGYLELQEFEQASGKNISTH